MLRTKKLSHAFTTIIAIFIALMGTLQTAADTTNVTINQQLDGGQWNVIDSFYFFTGSAGTVTISNEGADGYVVADAVRFANDDTTIIIDNSETAFVTTIGAWSASTSQSGYQGTDYVHDGNIDQGNKSVKFSVPVPEDGTYKVALNWTSFTNRATNIPVEIVSNVEPLVWQLTVENGTGSGQYLAGTVVEIAAEVASPDLVFRRWVSEPLSFIEEPFSKTTTITMPNTSTKVTAIWRDTTAMEVQMAFLDSLGSGIPQTVVTYGTSLTDGSVAGAWVGMLADEFDTRYPGLCTVVNSGASGEWSQYGVDNVQNRVVAHEPDAVFIEFAMNDAVDRFNCDTALARTNLHTIINAIHADFPFCDIILMTMNPTTAGSPRPNLNDYYEVYRETAAQFGYLLVDNYATWNDILMSNPSQFANLDWIGNLIFSGHA